MDRKQWEIVDDIVNRALNLPVEERYSFIQEQCAKDNKLKKEVIEYVESIEESETNSFLEKPAELFDELYDKIENIKDIKSGKSWIGETIANYKILDLIERGGMGSVYVAERTDDAYQKKVALKLLKPGMDTPSNIARFKRERNILANLEHPNITNLLDGGITSDGLPFLVMDYVDGMPLLTYCDAKQCTLQERLELFKTVCKAVRHAHKNAVIHRDLKPSNILITGDGKVNVLDFGIAKLIGEKDELRQQTIIKPADNALTLKYAAPEQIAGEPVTISTDIHALGVLLYELLTGVYPFDIEEKRITEIEEVIKNQRPPEPSKRIKQIEDKERKKISERRQTPWEEFVQHLAGDLDAIVCKTLFKNPGERYSTVDKLLEDLDRIKKHRPVSARKHTPGYKTAKFLHRRKKEIAVAATFILVVSGFFAYHTAQINHEKNIAQQEARTAEEVSGFLMELFDTDSNRDTLSVAGLLEEGMNQLETLEHDPTHVNLLSVMGEAYMNFGDYKKAGELLQEAVGKSRSVHGEMSVEHASTLYKMGLLHEESFKWPEAVSNFRKSYNLHKTLLGDNHFKTVDVLSHLAMGLRNTGKLEDAERYARKAVYHFEEVLEPTDGKILSAFANLAYVLREREKYDEAESIYRKLIARSEDNPRIETRTLAEYYNNRGYLYRIQERYIEATENYLRATHLKGQSYSEGHPELINSRKNLATSLYFQDRIGEADSLFKKNVSGIREKYSTQHWRTASALNTLGLFYLESSQYEAAEPLLRESTQINREVLGDDHLWTAYSEGLLSACLKFQQKENELSDSLYRHHLKLYRENRHNFDINHKHQLDRLARIYEINGARDSLYMAYREMLD